MNADTASEQSSPPWLAPQVTDRLIPKSHHPITQPVTIFEENKMLEYILHNKEWLFSGLGIAIVSWFFIRNKTSQMKQKGGNNSTNIQVGGNLEIKDRDNHNGPK